MEYFGKVIGRDVKEYTIEKERVQKVYLERLYGFGVGINHINRISVGLVYALIYQTFSQNIKKNLTIYGIYIKIEIYAYNKYLGGLII